MRWQDAKALTRQIRPTDSWRQIFAKLGYAVQQLPNRGHLARAEGAPVVVVHPKRSAAALSHADAHGRLPEGLLLEDCDAQGAPYGVLAHGGRFRLFDARSASPASEWLELDSRLLGGDRKPYLALLAPAYLADGGFAALRTEARNFGVALHKRLDRTIRQDALPALAEGMQRWARAAEIELDNDREREELEQAALTLVFRVVFILFCESAGHLLTGSRSYKPKSLSSLVREAHDSRPRLSPASSALWDGFMRLVRAMRNGNPASDVPAYNGPLFSARGFPGARLLERMELRDPEFAQVLVAVGQDRETNRGADFSTLEIAHIGHTYESLLSLRLSVAQRPLRYNARKDRYVPAGSRGDVDVNVGGLLWQTHQGGRKASGVYYTPVEIVRHLVKGAVRPAFERHLDEVAELSTTDPERAARHLLSFAVVDPACGSAHFLVQVTERLAELTVRFLAKHPLPGIVEAMERLREVASPGIEIDDLALLRRLLVKHCVFGVDKSAMGAEVATLSLWLASFVPGLSLSWLGRNVRVGDSLIGVADPGTVVPEGSLFTEAFQRVMGKRRIWWRPRWPSTTGPRKRSRQAGRRTGRRRGPPRVSSASSICGRRNSSDWRGPGSTASCTALRSSGERTMPARCSSAARRSWRRGTASWGPLQCLTPSVRTAWPPSSSATTSTWRGLWCGGCPPSSGDRGDERGASPGPMPQPRTPHHPTRMRRASATAPTSHSTSS